MKKQIAELHNIDRRKRYGENMIIMKGGYR